MKNKSPKQIVLLFKIKCVLIVLLYALALAVCVFVMSKNALVAIAAIVVLAASVRAPFDKLIEKDIESIIHEELDPQKYNEVLSLGLLKKSNRHQVLGAMCVGDHERLLALVKENDTPRSHPVEKCNNIYRRGYVHFEKGEFDALRGIVREFEKLKKDNARIAQVFSNFTVFDKYDAFADEDYEYVVDVCDIDLKDAKAAIDKPNQKLTIINVSFYRAVSLYKLGRLDEAKQGFEELIAFAPKMYKAKLSKDYLDLIEKEMK